MTDRKVKIVSWFSCGAASAVHTKLLLHLYPKADITIARCIVKNEHVDNDRFAADCEAWFRHPVVNLASKEYEDCWDVWEKRSYISGINGAPCTIEMKKAVRWTFEKQWHPDFQGFGYTAEEEKRAARFREQNPEVRLLTKLIDLDITKEMCKQLVAGRGIKLPVMYDLGFLNNNCIGCAKATSIIYWARTRHYFPDVFARMSELSRRLGCRLTRLKGKRIFLDEIPADIDWQKKDRENVECSLLCVDERIGPSFALRATEDRP